MTFYFLYDIIYSERNEREVITMQDRIMTDAEWDKMVDEMIDQWAAEFEMETSYQTMIEHQWTLSQEIWDSEV